MCACRRLVLEDGSVLRALLPGRPTLDCLFSDVLLDNATLLKVPHISCVEHTAVLSTWCAILPATRSMQRCFECRWSGSQH